MYVINLAKSIISSFLYWQIQAFVASFKENFDCNYALTKKTILKKNFCIAYNSSWMFQEIAL